MKKYYTTAKEVMTVWKATKSPATSKTIISIVALAALNILIAWGVSSEDAKLFSEIAGSLIGGGWLIWMRYKTSQPMGSTLPPKPQAGSAGDQDEHEII